MGQSQPSFLKELCSSCFQLIRDNEIPLHIFGLALGAVLLGGLFLVSIPLPFFFFFFFFFLLILVC